MGVLTHIYNAQQQQQAGLQQLLVSNTFFSIPKKSKKTEFCILSLVFLSGFLSFLQKKSHFGQIDYRVHGLLLSK